MLNASATTTVRTAMVGVLEAGRIVTHHVSTLLEEFLTSGRPSRVASLHSRVVARCCAGTRWPDDMGQR
jgi:hypothetical protein